MNHYSNHYHSLLYYLARQCFYLAIMQKMVLSYLLQMLSLYLIGMDHYSFVILSCQAVFYLAIMKKVVPSYLLQMLSLYHIGMDHYSFVILSCQAVFLPGHHAKDCSLIPPSIVVFVPHRNGPLLLCYIILPSSIFTRPSCKRHFSHTSFKCCLCTTKEWTITPLLYYLARQYFYLAITQKTVLSYLLQMLSMYHIGMDHYSFVILSCQAVFLPGHHAKDCSLIPPSNVVFVPHRNGPLLLCYIILPGSIFSWPSCKRWFSHTSFKCCLCTT